MEYELFKTQNDNARFVPDKHASFNFYSAGSLKQ